jgi:RNA polymerase sigma-70 factor, ECF subfamily
MHSKSFRQLIEHYGPALSRLALRLTQDADEAEDLIQETWLRVYAARGRYRPSGSLWGWLAAICTNVHIDARRSGMRRRRREALAASFVEADEPMPADERVVVAARRRALRDAVERLPQREREIVLRRAFGGQDVSDVARDLRCAPSTVRATTTHARRRLRQLLSAWTD